MSNAADIAAHTQRSTAVCLRTHAAVTDPSSRKADADERRHCRAAANGALSRLIRELNATVDVAVGTNTIALFSRRRTRKQSPPRSAKRSSHRRAAIPTLNRQQTAAVPVITTASSSSPSPAPSANAGTPLDRTRRRSPRGAVPRNV